MARPHLLLDADAFLALRKLSVLQDLLRLVGGGHFEVGLTAIIRNHDLHTVRTETDRLHADGVIAVHVVDVDGPAGRFYARLRRNPRTSTGKAVHKGEQEAIAWAVHSERRVLWISCDAGARDLARDHHIETGDVLALVCALVRSGHLTQEAAKNRLRPWDEVFSGMCRPKDYAGLDEALRHPPSLVLG